MKLKQLHYFMAIAEYLNYKYAAEAVDVSPSLLSQQIVGLEEELDVHLFERSRKSVRLTAAGEELKKRVPEIENLVAETLRVAAKMREDELVPNALHIGYDYMFDASMLTRVIRDLNKQNRNTFYVLRQHAPDELAAALEKNEIDCAFMLLPIDVLSPEQDIRVIKKDRLVLLVHESLRGSDSKEISDKLNVLRDNPLLVYLYNPYGTESVIGIYKHLGIKPKVKICTSMEEIFAYVEAGLGCTILPCSFVQRNLKSPEVEILEISGNVINSVCLSLVSNQNHRTDEMEVFLEQFQTIDPQCASCQEIFCTHWKNPLL